MPPQPCLSVLPTRMRMMRAIALMRAMAGGLRAPA